jgi:probable HAF family extracellular repeat protein
MKDLGPLADGFYSEATGINDAGQVAGWSDTGSYDNGYLEYSAVRYAADGVAQNLGVPLGETNSFGQAINASGSVVGYTYSTGTAYLALLFSSNGGIKLLGTLPNGSSSLALGINKSGQIVGEADVGTVDANDNPIYHAFLYTGGAMYDLNSLCKNSTGYRIEYGAGINDSGEIVGYMLAPSGQIHAMLLVPLLTSPPIITTQPASKNAGAGGSVTFTVAALSGTTFHYQWEKNGVAISGATSTKLTLTKVVPSNDGNYTVVVTNKVGSVTSSKAALTVIGTGASIATEPKSVLKAKAGATVTFKVVAKGTAPFSYQWQFNGGNLKNAENYTGATTATLTIKKVNAGNAGNYQVLVWNVVNASKPAKSTVVQLTIK